MGLEARNPATGEVIGTWAEFGRDRVDVLIEDAYREFQRHRLRSFEERGGWLRRVAELLDDRKEQYARLMTEEMGKLLSEARGEVEKCAWVCRYYAEHGAEFLAPESIPTDASRSGIRYQPLGPVLAVMPWNFPFWQVFRFAAPALMAGNVGLLKHASNVPGSAQAIEEVIRDGGFPDGCFTNLAVGSSRVEEILRNPRIAAVTLTGSEGAGRAVGRVAGSEIKHVVLELGGSDPFIVMPSADVRMAAETAVRARMINNGQSCIAAKRFIVHQDVADEFEGLMSDIIRGLRVGDPTDEDTDIGPLAREEFADDLVGQIERTVAAGGRLLTGGARLDRPGYYVEPTLIADVEPGMPAFDEETFGPLAALIRARDADHAVELANGTSFGLGASAWTSDPGEAEQFIDRIEAGSVFINGMVKSDPRLPFGGVRASGVGRELSRFGIREFCNIKTVWRA